MVKKYYLIALIFIFLSSCGGNRRPAPVRNISTEPINQKLMKSGQYEVMKTDTLYSIAFRFGIDYQQLAAINHIKLPYRIYPGEILQIEKPQQQTTKVEPPVIEVNTNKNKNIATQQNKATIKPIAKNKNKNKDKDKELEKNTHASFDTNKKVTGWLWPVAEMNQKKILSVLNDKHGINIAGKKGEIIRASADGRVVYSGNGLIGYGNLIIIKHNQFYLSAYAHNDKLMVKEKESVKAGQKIATMGKNATGQVQLHFEIRYQGRQVNPMKYLPGINK